MLDKHVKLVRDSTNLVFVSRCFNSSFQVFILTYYFVVTRGQAIRSFFSLHGGC